MLNTSDVIGLARKHIGAGDMESSARLCLADAVRLADAGELGYARTRALESLAYSVGVFHDDYRAARAK